MRTSELTRAALDWIVDNLENVKNYGIKDWLEQRPYTNKGRYSTNWAQGGPIIEAWAIDVGTYRGAWRATRHVGSAPTYGYGPTPLIAAMRCYVASKMGDEIDIPEELK